jgi:hypothetical protein
MTGHSHDTRMRGIRTVAAALVAASAAVGAAGAAGGGPALPPGWTHAEINFTAGGISHTLILDRGRVQSVSATGLALREQDGSVVDIPVSAQTKVRVNGRLASLAAVRVGFQAQARRVDGGAAKVVRAFRARP